MSTTSRRHWLRQSVRPYLGQLIIIGFVGAFSVIIASRTGEWGLARVQPLIWLFFAPIVWLGRQYRIAYDEDGIYQRASGGLELFIPYSHLAKAEYETSTVSELIRAARPFRRLVFYAAGGGARIDVSLKHFAREDIDVLLAVIQRRCPKLTMPVVV